MSLLWVDEEEEEKIQIKDKAHTYLKDVVVVKCIFVNIYENKRYLLQIGACVSLSPPFSRHLYPRNTTSGES